MIKLEKEKKVWITSDTHYGHTNICRGVTNWRLPNGDIPVNQTRDFPTIEKIGHSVDLKRLRNSGIELSVKTFIWFWVITTTTLIGIVEIFESYS